VTLVAVAIFAFCAGWGLAWWLCVSIREVGMARFQQAEWIVRQAEGRATSGRVTAGDLEWAKKRAREERLGMGQ